MTQQELQDLIADYLGPIVDQAQRMTDTQSDGNHLAEYLANRTAFQGAQITENEFNARTQKMIASWNHQQRLAFYVQLAREDGMLPPLVGKRETLNDTRLASDWETFVTA
jgi:hypothetical protein